MASFKRNAFRIFLLGVVVCLAVWLVRMSDARQILRQILQKIDALGPSAPIWFILTYIAACLTFFPGFILTMGAGILFGILKGTLYVSIGATLGASCAFLLSRHVAREWVMRKFGANTKFRAIDDAVAKDGWKIVGLMRLSPVIPFIPMNFVFGLTKIPFIHFFLITWISIIPMCLVFVYLGSLIGDVATLGTKPVASGNAKWIISGIGVGMTIIATAFITRIAKKALATRLPEEE